MSRRRELAEDLYDDDVGGSRAAKRSKHRHVGQDLEDSPEKAGALSRRHRSSGSSKIPPTRRPDPIPVALRPTSNSRGEFRGATAKGWLSLGPAHAGASNIDLRALLSRPLQPRTDNAQFTFTSGRVLSQPVNTILTSATDEFNEPFAHSLHTLDDISFELPVEDSSFYVPTARPNYIPLSRTKSRSERRSKSWLQWAQLLRGLCTAYLEYKEARRSSRIPQQDTAFCHRGSCTQSEVYHQSIRIISLIGISQDNVTYCKSCLNLHEALVLRGFFPCTPFQPGTAVSIELLELYCALHVRNSTPVTAFGDALVAYIGSIGHHFHQAEPFREQLPDAITWFDAAQREITRQIDERLKTEEAKAAPEETNSPVVAGEHIEQAERATPNPITHLSTNTIPVDAEERMAPPTDRQANPDPMTNQSASRRRTNIIIEDEPENEPASMRQTTQQSSEHFEIGAHDGSGTQDRAQGRQAEPSTKKRPCETEDPEHTHSAPHSPGSAAYRLRKLCPLCFGRRIWGGNPRCSPDAVVAIDGNFQHKQKRGIKEDPAILENLFIIDDGKVKNMEDYVKECRRKGARAAKSKDNPLPDSVLNACEESHSASDENRTKSSEDVWSEQGLMALVCRHDRPIFLIRIKGGGEKHHYALALIDELFSLLPAQATIGLLYDISCQLSRGFAKWGYLPQYADRISFATSVFHAYVHQWACQAFFHPRKCLGFGLTNGEGCERLWSFLADLIALERTMAPNKRIFLIEGRLEHFIQVLNMNSGKWLDIRMEDAKRRLTEAIDWLKTVGKSEEVIRQEWRSQRESVISVRSYKAGHVDGVMQHLLAAQNESSKFHDRMMKVRQVLTQHSLESSSYAVWYGEHQRLEQAHQDAQQAFMNNLRVIGTQGSDDVFAKFAANDHDFVRRLLQVQVLQEIVRKAVTDVQMEAAPLGRVKRGHSQTGKAQGSLGVKQTTEIQKRIKKRGKSRAQAIKLYNDACAHLKEVRRPEWHMSSPFPEPISADVLEIGIEDNIWQDIYLGQPTAPPPAWVTDRQVRLGILYVLQRDRCLEEIERLEGEVANLAHTLQATLEALLRIWQHLREGNDSYRFGVRDRIIQVLLQRRRITGRAFHAGLYHQTDEEVLGQLDASALEQWSTIVRKRRTRLAKVRTEALPTQANAQPDSEEDSGQEDSDEERQVSTDDHMYIEQLSDEDGETE